VYSFGLAFDIRLGNLDPRQLSVPSRLPNGLQSHKYEEVSLYFPIASDNATRLSKPSAQRAARRVYNVLIVSKQDKEPKKHLTRCNTRLQAAGSSTLSAAPRNLSIFSLKSTPSRISGQSTRHTCFMRARMTVAATLDDHKHVHPTTVSILVRLSTFSMILRVEINRTNSDYTLSSICSSHGSINL
jgi:hypothetical protein